MHSTPFPQLPAFGARLRQMRRARDLKQSALAYELGVDQSTLSRWEAGYQAPDIAIQRHAFQLLSQGKTNDFTLRRLVESSTSSLHLIEEATHKCLAFSQKRASDWGDTDSDALIGTSLWRFATTEIQAAEKALDDGDWWSARMPQPKSFLTGGKTHSELNIQASRIIWERLYLADGTPVRLCTALL